MSELRKANTDHAFFITLTVAGWVDVFNRDSYIQIIYSNLEFCRKNKGLEIYAYVIMSSHIHLIVRQKEGKLNEWIRDFKSFTAKKLIEAIQQNEQESRKEWILYLFKYFANNLKQNKENMFTEGVRYRLGKERLTLLNYTTALFLNRKENIFTTILFFLMQRKNQQTNID